jgi:hypothetical protein
MASTFTSHENGYSPMGKPMQYPHTAIAEIIGNGFFMVDQRWTVFSWNHLAEEILGISAADVVGKNVWTQFRGAIPEVFYTSYRQASLQEIPIHFEIYWPKMKAWFDVTTCHVDDCLSVSFKSNKHPEEPESSLWQHKSLNDMYRLITELTTDCLWEWDLLAEQIFWIDGGHKRVFGYDIQNALIPQRFWEARLYPDDKVRIMTAAHKFITECIADDWSRNIGFKSSMANMLMYMIGGTSYISGIKEPPG